MVVKLFILGLPGSGKSGAVLHISDFMRGHRWIVQYFKDYDILYEMYKEDNEGKRFRSTKTSGYDGFDVLDFSAPDEALEKLERKVSWRQKPADSEKDLIIIEFSRVDYCKALNFFASHLDQDAHILFIDADITTCKRRIKNRVDHPKTTDDHYVSEYIFTAYYEQDHRDYANQVAAQLNAQFSIGNENIQVIYNGSTVTEQQFYDNVRVFTENILLLDFM